MKVGRTKPNTTVVGMAASAGPSARTSEAERGRTVGEVSRWKVV
jgi:hypothetical protein